MYPLLPVLTTGNHLRQELVSRGVSCSNFSHHHIFSPEFGKWLLLDRAELSLPPWLQLCISSPCNHQCCRTQHWTSLTFYSFLGDLVEGCCNFSVFPWNYYFWSVSQMYLEKRNEIQRYDCASRANVLLVVAISPIMLPLNLLWYSWNAFKPLISSLEWAKVLPCMKASPEKRVLSLLWDQSRACV